MWDLKLTNNCNHKIINEPLSYITRGNQTYAYLKRPAIGNNHFLVVVNQDYLYSVHTFNGLPTDDFHPVYCELSNQDYRTISFNTANKSSTQLKNYSIFDNNPDKYPANIYYATYYTDSEHCPKCISRESSLSNDISFSVLGVPITIEDFKLTVQQIKKIITTQKGTNVFNSDYGTGIPELIGKPKNMLVVVRTQYEIQNCISYLQSLQMNNMENYDISSYLAKIDNFQLEDISNSKTLKFSFQVYSPTKTETINLTI